MPCHSRQGIFLLHQYTSYFIKPGAPFAIAFAIATAVSQNARHYYGNLRRGCPGVPQAGTGNRNRA